MNSFALSLLITFLASRSWAYSGYRANNYFDSEDNPNTIIGWLRAKTGFGWHTIHFATLIFFIASLLIYSEGFTFFNKIILGICTSMILDQIFPLIGNWNYFSKKMFLISTMLHVITILASIRVSKIISFLN